jgi:hypothetical protein
MVLSSLDWSESLSREQIASAPGIAPDILWVGLSRRKSASYLPSLIGC